MTQKTPRIVVLIPAYNATKTIEKTIASLNANAEPHDIVIVDDGSVPPLSSWYQPQPNVKIICAPKNGGITKALNSGLAYIFEQGYDYVARLDVDDFAAPERLEKQRLYLDEHPEIGFLGSWSRYFSEDGKILFHLHHPTDHDEILKKLYYNMCFLHVELMMRVSLLREVGGYDETFLIAQDYELVRRLLLHTRAANIPEYLVDCTMVASGISVKKRKMQLISRLRIQWRYRNWQSVHFYLGIAKTLSLFLLPFKILNALKGLLSAYKAR